MIYIINIIFIYIFKNSNQWNEIVKYEIWVSTCTRYGSTMVPRRLLAATLEIPSCKLTKPTIVGPDPKPRFGETVLVLEGASGPNSWLGSQTIVLTSHRKREGSRQYWSAAFRVPDNGGIGVLSVSKNFFNTNLPDINWGLIPCYHGKMFFRLDCPHGTIILLLKNAQVLPRVAHWKGW